MTTTNKTTFYLVVYNENDCICLPMKRDEDCDGALCVGDDSDEIAAFATHAEAKKAIEISKRFYSLRRAQGKPANDDFDKKNLGKVKIMCCCVDPAKEAGGK